MPVVRDYIPEAKDATQAERDRFENARSAAGGRTARDFIPGKGHKLRQPSGTEASHQEALDRAMARQASSAREEFDAAVMKLKDQTVSQAVEAIRRLPMAVQEMTLVAEALNGNRSEILDRFPGVDPSAVTRWTEINAGAPDSQTGGLGAQKKV